ncbi:hypothetical protein PR202_gb07199 [Eleusine coracana subsp. coracana]|uniref:Uncharacterized protein n=1 Tax=Eleusine coracana subsp. coracana TaxID=191504 RepID=A0AAV5E9U1_ELECO|nr:hypothetical protein PR202_gb07199 [Eleusine coracana subsp. coracana]
METCWWLLAGAVLLPLLVLLRRNGKNKYPAPPPAARPAVRAAVRQPPVAAALRRRRGAPPPAPVQAARAHRHPPHRVAPGHLRVRPAPRPRGARRRQRQHHHPRLLRTHAALVGAGAALADRPRAATSALLGVSDNIITRACYGPTWRLLRRNLVSETLHPSRVRLFAPARAWVRRVLAEKLREAPVGGDRLDEPAVRAIERAERSWLLFIARKLSVFFFFPCVTKHALRRRQRELFVPLINARREYKKKLAKEGRAPRRETTFEHSYVDTLLDVTLPDENGNHRPLTDDEIVTLCSEFLNAGTDTTSTGLQWIMAELVKNPAVQEKLHDEIKTATCKDEMTRSRRRTFTTCRT